MLKAVNSLHTYYRPNDSPALCHQFALAHLIYTFLKSFVGTSTRSFYGRVTRESLESIPINQLIVIHLLLAVPFSSPCYQFVWTLHNYANGHARLGTCTSGSHIEYAANNAYNFIEIHMYISKIYVLTERTYIQKD